MKTKKIMLYLIIFIAIIGLIFIIGKINFANKFNKEVTQLFAESKNISAKIFTYKQLEGLPEPVERYFKHVLKDGQPYISYIRLQHDGVIIPTHAEVFWRLKEGDFSYANFNVTKIEYDIPERF